MNDSGSDEYPFGGPANVAFDRRGYAWITNNVVQGKPYSTRGGVIVLKPNGRPADGEGDTPTSPIASGGLLGPGYGIGIDTRGNVWVGNFGWGGTDYQPSPHGNGSVSQFDALGRPLSGDNGYQGGTDRAQATVSDRENNIWIASYGNNRVVVFPKGDPERAFHFHQKDPDVTCPFDIAIAEDGSAWVTYSGGLGPKGQGSVGKYRIENGAVVEQFCLKIGHSLKGMSLDSQGNAWVRQPIAALLKLVDHGAGAWDGAGAVERFDAIHHTGRALGPVLVAASVITLQKATTRRTSNPPRPCSGPRSHPGGP